MKSNSVCGINFATNSYSLFKNNSVSDKIRLPGSDGTDFSIPGSLGTANEIIYFDLWGTAYITKTLTSPRHTGNIGTLGISIIEDTGCIQ